MWCLTLIIYATQHLVEVSQHILPVSDTKLSDTKQVTAPILTEEPVLL